MHLCLNLLGCGVQYYTIGDMYGVSKATVCRVVRKVTKAIYEVLFPQLIRWPNNMITVVKRYHNIAVYNVGVC